MKKIRFILFSLCLLVVVNVQSMPPPVRGLNLVLPSIPGSSAIDYVTLELPSVGDSSLHILSPTLLELKLITTKQPDPAPITQWNLVNNSQFITPPLTDFTITINGKPTPASALGFKRRPLYAPISSYDLRIENSLYIKIPTPILDNQTVQVLNTNGSLWPSSTQFIAKADPLRYNPAIHVNQEGYMPRYSKMAMVGYYLGSLGEMEVPIASGFKILDATSGVQVFKGKLTRRIDSGYTYSPAPYQQVYEANFTDFNVPGKYRLVVPGMGSSMPFRIDGGIAINFVRAYALGLYHQRCGTSLDMPYTRFTHDKCHAAPASVPVSAAAYPFTWTTIADYAKTLNPNNPPQVAPALINEAAQLFPFINTGPIDVSGGHHDAGDYSKYTANSANLIHSLMFSVDSLGGLAFDNFGIPESGDGISDIMQIVKWEADFLAKMQDSDGGFYFLVYPRNREYESGVTPDKGDPQVVWPKTTTSTAAAVAALAQCASSSLFRRTYPVVAAEYRRKAQLGWDFLLRAVNKYGKNNAYQKITHYGDNFADNDELAWAACQIYLAIGDPMAHQMLLSWFDPSDPSTWRWGWWHMSECYGNAIRSYTFATQSGRTKSAALDAEFLSKCRAQIIAGADDMLKFSQQNSYGSSFPIATKAVRGAGWYFSCDQAFDLAVANQLAPNINYLNAMLQNMNYEGGCNPVNVSYITGVGLKGQRDIVSQWAVSDDRILPPSGIPVGNISSGFGYLWNYGPALRDLSFPSDSASSAPYPYYDRWGDSWNVNNEMVILNQSRGLGTLAALASQTVYKAQRWVTPQKTRIVVPTKVVAVDSPTRLFLEAPNMNMNRARVTWEGSNKQVGNNLTFDYIPKNNGVQWVEAEAVWPDGRRIFVRSSFRADSPNIVWMNDALPLGAVAGADGGDSWNWVSNNPTPYSGKLSHQSAISSGQRQHFFFNASSTLSVGTNDELYAYVYIDPVHVPSEIMLQWNDGSSWEHRAYWGDNKILYGVDNTPSRIYMGVLPPTGRWVRLTVPVHNVDLGGKVLSGMAFTTFGGKTTWGMTGRYSSNTGISQP